jgi:LysM domain
MSVVAHRTSERTERVQPAIPAQRRRREPVAPPSRRRVVRMAPRVVARPSCEPRQHLPVRWMVAIAGVACAAVVGLGALASTGEASVPDRTTVVRVEPGENLWDLAGRVAPGSDTSAVVDRIRDLNGGLTSGVTPGQPLTVPTE